MGLRDQVTTRRDHVTTTQIGPSNPYLNDPGRQQTLEPNAFPRPILADSTLLFLKGSEPGEAGDDRNGPGVLDDERAIARGSGA
ncbi:hypothetical protein BH23PLA1_BH23PLA1_06420 [soil metagenome]